MNHIPLIHFSTDYVFSGEGTTPWKESDAIYPLNIYGKTKAAGEEKIKDAGGRHLIFRTSWVYDTEGKNFLRTMLKLAQDREVLRVVNDQFGAPTFASDLAKGAWQAVQNALAWKVFPSGTYHLCNDGETTWFHFAKAIFEEASKNGIELKIKQLDPISSSDFPTPAKRPFNSRLNTRKISEQLNVKMPDWRESLNLSMAKYAQSIFKEFQ